MIDAQTRLFGWCQTHGKPDQFHALCRREIKSAAGVTHVCSCPKHDEEETA